MPNNTVKIVLNKQLQAFIAIPTCVAVLALDRCFLLMIRIFPKREVVSPLLED